MKPETAGMPASARTPSMTRASKTEISPATALVTATARNP
jgi:hypothetical protein